VLSASTLNFRLLSNRFDINKSIRYKYMYDIWFVFCWSFASLDNIIETQGIEFMIRV
jgi:hypothetical protein